MNPITGKIKIILYAVGGLIVLVLVIRFLRGSKRRARQETKQEKKTVKAEIKNSATNLRGVKEFDPDFQLGKSFKPLSNNVADLYAENLRKAIRGLGTNEDIIYITFGKFYNKANISEVAARYYLKFKRNLLVDILSDLNDKEQKTLFDIIKKLPDTT